MGIGKFVIENKRIPLHMDISFKDVEPNKQLLPHSWLSDALIYLSTSVHPTLAVLFVLYPLFGLSLFLLFEILNLIETPKSIIYFCLAIATISASSFWKLHPLIFATPILLTLVLIYFRWREGDNNLLLAYPFLFLLFANLAGGYIFIPISFLLLIFLSEGLLFFLKDLFVNPFVAYPKGNFLYLALASLGSFLSSFLNPSGGKILSYLLTIVNVFGERKAYSNLAGALFASNTNSIKNAPSTFFYAIFLVYFLFVIFSFVMLLIRDRTKFLKEVYPSAILVIFLFLGYWWIRFIPLSIFITLPLFSIIISYLAKKIHFKPFYGFLALFPLTLFAILLLIMIFNPPGVLLASPPKYQIDFVIKTNLKPKVLPSFELAGYTFYSLYPQKGFLDAQDDLFDENEGIYSYSPLVSFPQGFFENIAKTYDINTVISTKDTDYLNVPISENQDWVLVYLGYNGLIFVKKSSLPQDFLQKKALSHINLARNLGFNPEDASKAQEELERFISENPESSLAIGQLASIYRFQQNYEEAEKTLMKIPQKQWDFIVMTEMGRVKAAQGLCKSSEDWYLKALSLRNEQNVSRAVLDLAVLYGACFKDKEKARHFFQRYNSYPLPTGERERVRKIAKDFGIALDDADKE